VLSAAFTLLKAGVKKAEKYQEDVNEKDISDHSSSVAVSGMGRGANLAQHAAVNNTATVHISINNLTQPATRDARYQLNHNADHDHANHSDLKQQ
jgi:hypothetical protein